MARITPTPGQKILYLLCTLLGIAILYIDFNTDNFQKIKYSYKSFIISSSYFLKTYTIDFTKEKLNLNKSKKALIKENESLKKALDVSYLNNYLISKENNFYKDENILKYPFDNKKIIKYSIAKLKSLDPNIFNCCDKHRMYIEIISNNKENNEESVVFNSSGIIGQVLNESRYLEVILLTDTSHSIPIKSISEEFFCNARGAGRAHIISCSYNPLIWKEEIELDKVFYTSGLGGIYPRDIRIGNVLKIKDISATKKYVEIKLTADPLESNLFGVIKD
tara:strand:- start:389 stop:1222 length:834 start_codon:yes stop_codon:yes gene_type:complete